MAHNGKRYTKEFKRQIIYLYLAGKPIAQLAEEYGLIEQTIYKWKKIYAPTIEVDENKTITMKEYKDLQKKMEAADAVFTVKKTTHNTDKAINDFLALKKAVKEA